MAELPPHDQPHDRPDDPATSEEPTVSQPDLLLSDHDVITTAEPPAEPARQRPDALLMIVALLTLAMSVAAFTGWVPDLTGFDPRWLLAAAAAGLGAVLLASGLRHRRRR